MTTMRDTLTAHWGLPLLFMDPPEQFDCCIVGVGSRHTQGPAVVYDRGLVISALMAWDMTYEEATEYFEYNIACMWMGEHTPIYLDSTGGIV